MERSRQRETARSGVSLPPRAPCQLRGHLEVFLQTSHQRLRGVPPEAGPLPKESVAAPFRAQLASRALASNYQGDRVPLLDVVVVELRTVFEKTANTPQFLLRSEDALLVLIFSLM